MAGELLKIKRGDTIPISGVIAVTDGEVDVTSTLNFSLWEVVCRIEDSAGALFYNVPFPPLAGPIFYGEVPSATTETMVVNAKYNFDIRIKDETGFVRSTRTFVVSASDAISETP